jgi:hypothetical protein
MLKRSYIARKPYQRRNSVPIRRSPFKTKLKVNEEKNSLPSLDRDNARLRRSGRLKASQSRLRARPNPLMAEWTRKVLKRDGTRCQWPNGCATGDTRIDAHHIAERSLRPDLRLVIANGIALCRTHHNWLPLHRAEAVSMGLLSDETYEAAMKERAA